MLIIYLKRFQKNYVPHNYSILNASIVDNTNFESVINKIQARREGKFGNWKKG